MTWMVNSVINSRIQAWRCLFVRSIRKVQLNQFAIARKWCESYQSQIFQFPSLSELEEKDRIPDDDLPCTWMRRQHTWMRHVSEISGSFFDPNSRLGNKSILSHLQWGNRKDGRRTDPTAKWRWAEAKVQKILSRLLAAERNLWTAILHCLSNIVFNRVEHGFSAVAQLLSEQRNGLQITERGDLRLLLSDFQPDVKRSWYHCTKLIHLIESWENN